MDLLDRLLEMGRPGGFLIFAVGAALLVRLFSPELIGLEMVEPTRGSALPGLGLLTTGLGAMLMVFGGGAPSQRSDRHSKPADDDDR